MQQSIPEVHSFFDEATNAACYIVKDPAFQRVCELLIQSLTLSKQRAGRTQRMPTCL